MDSIEQIKRNFDSGLLTTDQAKMLVKVHTLEETYRTLLEDTDKV